MQPTFYTPAVLATNIPIQTISSYSAKDGLRPMYIAIGGITYKLWDVIPVRHDIIGGFAFKLFKCRMAIKGSNIDIVLSYCVSTHKWALIACNDSKFLFIAAQDTYTFSYPVDTFYSVPNTPIINRLSGNPVDVITTTNLDGKIRIDYIRYEDAQQVKHTQKIAYTQQRKSFKEIETYLCEHINDGKSQYVMLNFDVRNMLWVLG